MSVQVSELSVMTELESPSCRFGVKLIQRADCLIRLALCRVSSEKLGVKLCLPYSLKFWMEKKKCFRSPHRSNLSFRHSLIAARFPPAVVEPSGDKKDLMCTIFRFVQPSGRKLLDQLAGCAESGITFTC